MRDLVVLIVHLITTFLRLLRPGGVRAVVAESVLVKRQLLILNHSRRRAPNLRMLDRLIAGFCSLWIQPRRFCRAAIAFKPSTLLTFHLALVQRKDRLLFSPKQKNKLDPKGPTSELIRSVVEMKQRNPTWGCPHIADQINLAFGSSINKDTVRRILAQHSHPVPTEGSILAHVHRKCEGQFVEHRPVSVRIDLFANVLGTVGDGSVHSQNHRFWNTGRR